MQVNDNDIFAGIMFSPLQFALKKIKTNKCLHKHLLKYTGMQKLTKITNEQFDEFSQTKHT